jgi:WD40 repeat protein
VRCIDLKDGKVTKIFTGLVEKRQDEITQFRQINQFKMYLLSNQKGQMSLHNYLNGEVIRPLQPHHAEVSNLKIDYGNKLIVSSSLDSSIIIQKEGLSGYEVVRTVINCHNKKEIHLMELSTYHNLIVTGSNENRVYLYDYELLKVVGCVQLPEGNEPTAIQFLNGFGLLMIACNDGRIYFIKIVYNETKIQYQLHSVLHLEGLSPTELALQQLS